MSNPTQGPQYVAKTTGTVIHFTAWCADGEAPCTERFETVAAMEAHAVETGHLVEAMLTATLRTNVQPAPEPYDESFWQDVTEQAERIKGATLGNVLGMEYDRPWNDRDDD